MIEKFNKIINKIAKFENYYILKQEEKAAAVSHSIVINQLTSRGESRFMPKYKEEKTKELPIIFLITLDDKDFTQTEIVKEFTKKDIPVLYFYPAEYSMSSGNIKLKLEKFITKTFLE